MPVRTIFELPDGFDQLGQTQLKDLCIRLEAGFKEIKKEREEDELQLNEELEKSKIALEASNSTPVNRPMSSGQIVHDDVQSSENSLRGNNDNGLRETRIQWRSAIEANCG
ncbi:unnamed protein product, partial [Brachionus calyciflorus]